MDKKIILSSLLVGALAFSGPVFAGNPGQSGQSGQSGQCGQHTPKKCDLIKKMKESFKKGYNTGKKAGTKAFDAVQNKVADTGVAAKKKVTGKKCKTFVKGHYNKDGSHTKGHFRKVKCGPKKS